MTDRETEQAMKDAVERLTSEANTSADEAAVFWGYEARKRKRRHITRLVQYLYDNDGLCVFSFFFFFLSGLFLTSCTL